MDKKIHCLTCGEPMNYGGKFYEQEISIFEGVKHEEREFFTCPNKRLWRAGHTDILKVNGTYFPEPEIA